MHVNKAVFLFILFQRKIKTLLKKSKFLDICRESSLNNYASRFLQKITDDDEDVYIFRK